MRLPMPWMAVCAWAFCGHFLQGLVPAAAKPPANPPIVLQFQETPIFLGPHEHSVAAIAFSAPVWNTSANSAPFVSSNACNVVAALARDVITCSRFGRPSATWSVSAATRKSVAEGKVTVLEQPVDAQPTRTPTSGGVSEILCVRRFYELAVE